MNLVDTSGWIEYFFEGPNASYFSEPIEDTAHLVVPVARSAAISSQPPNFIFLLPS